MSETLEIQSLDAIAPQLETATTTYGHKITFFRGDIIGRKILKKGLYEDKELVFIRQLLDRIGDPVVLDIGANIGNHSLVFSQVAEAVLAFEPVSKTFAILKKNVTDNGISNIHCFNIAFSDFNGNAEIAVNLEGNLGASGFDKQWRQGATESVRAVRGDDFLENLELSSIDFLKIDVEGHEASVLKGLAETLHRHRPLVTMEWKDPDGIRQMTEAATLGHVFARYRIYAMGSDRDRVYWQGRPLWKIRRRLHCWFRTSRFRLYDFDPGRAYKNILLVPEEKLYLIADFT